jgi:hypothetical protein
VHWKSAADAADALLAAQDAGTVVRDPSAVWANDDVFVFTRQIPVVDDTVLLVDRRTGEARLLALDPLKGIAFGDLNPVAIGREDGR